MLMVFSNTFRYHMPGYDTLHLWLPKEQVSNTDLLAEIPPLLSKLKEGYNYHTNERSFSGWSGNIKVAVKESGVYATGSICKYFLNDNLHTLNLKQTKDAIAMLSDALHLPMCEADVTRIDIAENLVMDMPVSTYYMYLGKSRYYRRLEQNNGIEYRQGKKNNHGKKGMLFYDKIYEQELERVVIPEMLIGAYLLRYEFRFLKRLREQFNVPSLKAFSVYNEKFYNDILARWENEYFKIRKIKLPNFDLNILTDMKQFDKQIYLMGVEKLGGEYAIMQRIEQAKQMGLFKYNMEVKRAKDKVKKICAMQKLTFESDAILELDRKIKEAVKNS